MNGGRSSCQCVHLSFLDGWSIFTFIYEILFPASWKANVWISCSLVMSFSFDLGPFSGVWFLVSSLPFRFGQLFFIDILFFAPFVRRKRSWVFCSALSSLMFLLDWNIYGRSIPSLKLHSWPGERNFYHLKFRFHLYLRFFSAVWRSYLLCFSAWHLFMPYFPVKCW